MSVYPVTHLVHGLIRINAPYPIQQSTLPDARPDALFFGCVASWSRNPGRAQIPSFRPVHHFIFEQEGTELFKGQNYRQAGARYSKALTHAAKMFDLSSDEQKEVHAVQLSLYLNLAQCYLKLQGWDQVRPGEDAGGLERP